MACILSSWTNFLPGRFCVVISPLKKKGEEREMKCYTIRQETDHKQATIREREREMNIG